MYRDYEVNIIRNYFYFELLNKLNKNRLIVPDDIFKTFIEGLYDNEIKELMEEGIKHNHKKTSKSDMIMKEISNKINEFVSEQKERQGK